MSAVEETAVLGLIGLAAAPWALVAKGVLRTAQRPPAGDVSRPGQDAEGAVTPSITGPGRAFPRESRPQPVECADGRNCVNHCGSGPCSRRCQVCQRLAGTPSAPCPACPDATVREWDGSKFKDQP